MLINALCKSSLEAPGHVTKILQAENGLKVEEFEPIYSATTDIDEKSYAIFEHTINHLSFGFVRLPQRENYFSCFESFFLLFFSSFVFFCPSTFRPLNALHSSFERVKISGKTCV